MDILHLDDPGCHCESVPLHPYGCTRFGSDGDRHPAVVPRQQSEPAVAEFPHRYGAARTVEGYGTFRIRTGNQRPAAARIVYRHRKTAGHGNPLQALQHDTADAFIRQGRRHILRRQPQVTRIVSESERSRMHRTLLRYLRLHRSGHHQHGFGIESIRGVRLYGGKEQRIVRIPDEHTGRIQGIEPLL